jgi:hypothetical protein
MHVEFHKTGGRRYAVKIVRGGGLPDLEMNPAPGFDPLMPHDLMHFIVEQELDLKNAIFGQVASNRNAGNFISRPSESSNTRADTRFRRKEVKQRKKILKGGMDEYFQSERATVVCMYDWLSHSSNEKLRAKAAEMKDFIQNTYSQMSEIERQKFNKKKLAEIRKRMDELSKRWSALPVNQSLKLEWSYS